MIKREGGVCGGQTTDSGLLVDPCSSRQETRAGSSPLGSCTTLVLSPLPAGIDQVMSTHAECYYSE